MNRKQAQDFNQELLDLYDDYAHSRIGRRDFLQNASKFAVAGLTAEALLQMLSPNYALAEQVAADDPRIQTEMVEYSSPKGGGTIKGLLARPAKVAGKFPAVLVIHENRGLNPYIADVVRRLAVAGFLAFGPDALTPLGGYPGTDEKGRELQAQRDQGEMLQDFIAAAKFLKTHELSNGKLGAVGFCYGGGIVNALAVNLPGVLDAGVPYYGRQAASEDASKIKTPLLLHYAELDQRVNSGWPAYETALKKAGVDYEAFVYPAVNHGFHNDTTPRYDKQAAELSWERTLKFFKEHLG